MSTLELFLLLLLAAFISLALFVYFFFIHSSYSHHRFYRSQQIPAAPYVPITGHLPTLLQYDNQFNQLGFWKQPHTTAIQPLYALNLGPQTQLTINEPHLLYDITKRQASHFLKSKATRMYLAPSTGEQNLLLLEGAEHKRHRRMINPAFHFDKLKSMVETMLSETDAQIDAWLAAADVSAASSVETDVHKDMSHLTFNIIAASAFGTGFSNMPNASATLQSNIVEIGRTIQQRAMNLTGILPIVKWLPMFGRPTIMRLRSEIFAMVDSVIRDRKEGKTAVKTSSGEWDLLQLLLDAQDEKTGDRLTDAEVRDEAMSIVLAGHDTTANLMSWMLWKLMIRPELWRECRQEVVELCGLDAPSSEQLKQLPVLDAMINETLRMYPSVPLLSKEVVTRHTLQPHPPNPSIPPVTLPVHAEVIIGIHLIHRSVKYWGDDAKVFDHTRWLQPGKRPYTHELAFLPFSFGDRGCIGSLFARLEAKAMLCRILQRVRMEFVPGQQLDAEGAPVHTAIVTFRPKFGVLTRVSAASTQD